jgi:phage terminase large subunit
VNLEINTTVTFEHLLDAQSRITQHIGGTRSGKTYAILQWIIVQALQSPQTVTVVRKTIPSLKRTVIKDFVDILKSINIYSDDNYNSTDRIYKLYDSTIQFLSTDDADKLRGIKSDILFTLLMKQVKWMKNHIFSYLSELQTVSYSHITLPSLPIIGLDKCRIVKDL